jgi:hypothetical protein
MRFGGSVNKIRLFDGCFPRSFSATLAGDNKGEGPTFFNWCRKVPCGSLFSWYTDTNLYKASDDFAPERIAWLIEPPGISDTHYRDAYRNRNQFRKIFTFVRFFAEMSSQFEFYPFGGSWIHIDNWGLHDKTRQVSLIASKKDVTEGHHLRHLIARHYKHLDKFGTGYEPIESKMEGLAPYRYSIVVESWRGDYYFSEKLIDCLSVGTIPIYYGCPSIGEFFDAEGILSFSTMSGLDRIMSNLSVGGYEIRLQAIKNNIEIAKQFRCAEDWLFINHKEYLR